MSVRHSHIIKFTDRKTLAEAVRKTIQEPFSEKDQPISVRLQTSLANCKHAAYALTDIFSFDNFESVEVNLDVTAQDEAGKIVAIDYTGKDEFMRDILRSTSEERVYRVTRTTSNGIHDLNPMSWQSYQQELERNKSNFHRIHARKDGLLYIMQSHISNGPLEGEGMDIIIARARSIDNLPMGYLGTVLVEDLIKSRRVVGVAPSVRSNKTFKVFSLAKAPKERNIVENGEKRRCYHNEFNIRDPDRSKEEISLFFRQAFDYLHPMRTFIKREVIIPEVNGHNVESGWGKHVYAQETHR